MNTKAQTGELGENAAVTYLIEKGYSILERNYRHKRSEIDVIARHKSTIVFVEVKTKSSVNYGHPEVAVDDKKAAKVMEGADHYIQENQWSGPIRFDVISVIKRHEKFEIEHFEDAFY